MEPLEPSDFQDVASKLNHLDVEEKCASASQLLLPEGAQAPDEMTCAICLEQTPAVDIALIKGCEHQYCVHCILKWAMCKEWCPQCKAPFGYLLTFRQLDGTVTDYPCEESIVLLKRARWFTGRLQAMEAEMDAVPDQGHLAYGDEAAAALAVAAAADRDWADLYEETLDAELQEDEEIESFYMSSAAGAARVVLGNRRGGEGGFMRSGRMYARPVPTPNAGGGKDGGGGRCRSAKGAGGAGPSKLPKGSPPGPAGAGLLTPPPALRRGSGTGGSGGSSSSGAGGSSSGTGRRAKRSARRAACDPGDADADY